MQSALLNSIYKKQFQQSQEVIDDYVKNLYTIYLNLLNEFNIDDLQSEIQFRTVLPDGEIVIEKEKAGIYIAEMLFKLEDYKQKILELDQKFLESNYFNEEILNKIKNKFKMVASKYSNSKKVLSQFNSLFF